MQEGEYYEEYQEEAGDFAADGEQYVEAEGEFVETNGNGVDTNEEEWGVDGDGDATEKRAD